MIDIKKLRENPDYYQKATADKQRDPELVDRVVRLYDDWTKLLQKYEEFRRQRNLIAHSGKPSKDGQKIKEKLKEAEIYTIEAYKKYTEVAVKLPNPAIDGTPIGKDESGNVELRKWGKIPQFDFPVKEHWQLGEDLDLVDTQRAGKVSGTRFGYLKNEAVLLEMALVSFGLQTLIKKGFIPVLPPVMIRKEVMSALGYNNYGFDETYQITGEDLVLVATAEHALVPYFKDEVLAEGDLPKRFVGFSGAFRREAGSYGKDTKGILRVHQFNKLEMVSFCRPEDSAKEHEFVLGIEEELMQALEIPYHVMQMCTGDLGDPAAAKFDIEAWFPSENKYRETHSCSNCTDYQSRRLNIRVKRKSGETDFVHVLNGTVFSERPILAILENYQQTDGSVLIPEVLRDYVGKDKISPKS